MKQTTLDKLKGDTLTAVDNDLSAWFWDEKGISAGKSDKFKVKFEFVDNGKDQNQFQGDKLQLNWTFDAQQTAGEEDNKKRAITWIALFYFSSICLSILIVLYYNIDNVLYKERNVRWERLRC